MYMSMPDMLQMHFSSLDPAESMQLVESGVTIVRIFFQFQISVYFCFSVLFILFLIILVDYYIRASKVNALTSIHFFF